MTTLPNVDDIVGLGADLVSVEDDVTIAAIKLATLIVINLEYVCLNW